MVILGFKKMGYEIKKTPLSLAPGYEKIESSYSSYAPWSTDNKFREIYDIIYPYTMVDIYRCYEIWHLISQISKVDGAIIEIGVWKGGTAGIICKKVEIEGLNKKIYLADTFKGVAKASDKDKRYRGGEHSDTSIRIVNELLSKKLKLNNYKILEGIFPDESAHLVDDNQFSLCHIDVDTYDSAKDIVDWIWPKLMIGGIVVYDDYGFIGTDGITKFVNEEALKKDRLVIHNLNAHGIAVKLK
jgi:O-methyltransferase